MTQFRFHVHKYILTGDETGLHITQEASEWHLPTALEPKNTIESEDDVDFFFYYHSRNFC